MKFSVLVITFNSDINKLYLTLQSIIRQKFDDFEIVVSDDASEDNHFEQLEAFFRKNHFDRYRLVSHEKNQGTVKNLLSGLEYTDGKYVKFFGAGDAFYDENAMENVYQFMEKNQCEGCFGLIQGYRINQDGRVNRLKYYHPFDILAYRKRGMENRIVKNMVLYSDNVCGAAICYLKTYCVEYLKRIEGNVVYEEDIFPVLSAVEGRYLCLYDDYMIWYEIGDGISTKKRTPFEELLRQDVERFYRALYEAHGDNKYVKKRHSMEVFYRIRNLYLRTLLRFFVNPDAIAYLIRSFTQRIGRVHEPRMRHAGFLDQKSFWDAL